MFDLKCSGVSEKLNLYPQKIYTLTLCRDFGLLLGKIKALAANKQEKQNKI